MPQEQLRWCDFPGFKFTFTLDRVQGWLNWNACASMVAPNEKQPLLQSRYRRFFSVMRHRLCEFTGLGRAIGVAGPFW